LLEAAYAVWELWPHGDIQERRDHYRALLDKRNTVARGTEVHEAAALNDVQRLRSLLLVPPDGSLEVGQLTSNGETALHHAAYFGALDCTWALLHVGWDPCCQDSSGRTPLDYACYRHPADRGEDNGLDGADMAMVRHNRYAMILLLLLYGAPTEPTPQRNTTCPPAVRGLLEAWSGAMASIARLDLLRPRSEYSELAVLRNWEAFLEALLHPLAETYSDEVRVGCYVFRWVLEVNLAFRLTPKDSSQAASLVHGVYRHAGLYNKHPCYDSDEGECTALWHDGRWIITRGRPNVGADAVHDSEAGASVQPHLEGHLGDVPVVASSWPSLEVEMCIERFRTHVASGCLPPVAPDEDTSDDVPFLALVNPHSGSRMGAVFFDEARRFPEWRRRVFDIVEVASRPSTARAFRKQLDAVKQDAQRKMLARDSPHFRPRLICGGGDGTASFALWCVFRALFDDANQHLRWSDDDLQRYFPALVQMPLGTGNDLAGILGWGRKIKPSTDKAGSRTWLKHALSHRRPVQPFDVWGFYPADKVDRGFKVCSLARVPKETPAEPEFKEAGPSVPFLSLLYFSIGFDAFVGAQVELNRTTSRMANFLEYCKAVPAGILGAQRRNVDLTGVTIRVPSDDNEAPDECYFPPPHRSVEDSEYESVGFMNIDSIYAGIISATEKADFQDGRLDLFRQRDVIGNALRRGRKFVTQKTSRATFSVPPRLPGVHFQFDGESRFAFNPSNEGFEFEVRRVLQIPVVIGPAVNSEPILRSEGWLEVPDHDAGHDMEAMLPAVCINECKELCVRHNLFGFCVFNGKAYFRGDDSATLRGKLVPKPGATFYIREKSAEEVRFLFTGDAEEVQGFKERLVCWTSGKLASKMNAVSEEVSELEWCVQSYARGVCARSARSYVDLGHSVVLNRCATCARTCGNRRCKGCRRNFCWQCFLEHRETAPVLKWAYGSGNSEDFERQSRVSSSFIRSMFTWWSQGLCLDDCILEIENELGRRSKNKSTTFRASISDWRNNGNFNSSVLVKIQADGEPETLKTFTDLEAARDWILEYRQEDRERHEDATSLRTFIRNSRRERGAGYLVGQPKTFSERFRDIDDPIEDGDSADELESCHSAEDVDMTAQSANIHGST